MNNNIIKYRADITGKAETMAELQKQVNALNGIVTHCEPTSEELAIYVGKVNQAATAVTEVRRSERISELLALGNNSKMWEEFLKHRNFKGVGVALDKKSSAYKIKENDRCRISYPELNDAFIKAETARLEQAGEVFDPEALTIARDRRFNTWAPLFFRDAYRVAIERNLGANACDKKAYTLTARGTEIKGNAPSVNQLQKDLVQLVSFLLPENMDVKMVKADVRAIGLALVRAGADSFRNAGDGNGYNWLLNAIATRMEGKTYSVETDGADGLDNVRTAE